MLKQTILGLGVLGFLAAGGSWVLSETGQPAENSPQPAAAEDAAGETAPEGTAPDAGPAVPGETDMDVQSYSVVTENRIGPDGKQIRKRKVWQNGTLIEEKEEVIEGEEDQLSAEMDGETVPGIISRSEQNGGYFGIPGDLNLNEMLRGMREDMDALRAEMLQNRGEMLRGADEAMGGASDLLGELGMPGGQDDMDARRAEFLRRHGMAAPAALSEYWIGASVSPVSDDTAYQLGLAEGEGLLVREVVPGSPSEKAGLEKYDILLQIGEQPISSAEEIGEIVDGADGAPLTVQYIRKGERRSAELTPEKRPESQAAAAAENYSQPENAEQAAEREQIRVVRPGMILPEAQNSAPETAPPAPEE